VRDKGDEEVGPGVAANQECLIGYRDRKCFIDPKVISGWILEHAIVATDFGIEKDLVQ